MGTALPSPRSVLLVDPSLFTAPYDAALSDGLEAAGARPVWATRRLRAEEEDLLGQPRTRAIFYPYTDGPNRRTGKAWQAVKGIEHALGLRTLVRAVVEGGQDIVHFQWSLVPRLDLIAIRRMQRHAPVVLTVHDTTPYNGKSVSRAQTAGFADLPRAADRVIVHTEAGAQTLSGLGVPPGRIAVVPHGLLPTAPAPAAARAPGGRWRVTLFGKLQAYKGADVLIEALGRLAPQDRARLEVQIAGEPLIDVEPLRARARALGLGPDVLAFTLRRLAQDEMEALLAATDSFVFPYRAIDASGVLFQVAPLERWIIASDLGAFRLLLGSDGSAGRLVPPGDVDALARALVDSIGAVPTRRIADDVPDWAEIGRRTLDVYEAATRDWAQAQAAA